MNSFTKFLSKNSLIKFIYHLFIPKLCAFCAKTVNLDEDVCSACQKEIPNLRVDLATPILLSNRYNIHQKWYIDQVIAPFYFSDTVRQAVHTLKFRTGTDSAKVLASYMADAYREAGCESDVICYAPQSKGRSRERGYNQAELLARALSILLELPCEELLIKTRETQAQSSTENATQRAENVKNVYEVTDTAKCEEKRILLVDDVFTTGSTANECARMLHEAGTGEIICLILARSAR